jgi:LmbE family N-acetylglucosaminyl deacetylase
MDVVAHPDDDLLFLSPDLLHDVQAGRCVRTVFVTAGERGGDLDLLATREAGIKAAYAQMAGVSNSWTTTDAGVAGHPMPLVTLTNRPTVSLVFVRLPEGFWGDGGTNSDEELKNLWRGTVSQMHPEDGTPAYTKSGLISALTSLMTALQPSTIRTQDYVGTFGDFDHDDHHAAAYFARQAHLGYTTSHTFIGYQDYETENRPQNVFDPDLTAKQNAFNAYLAFDEAPCGSPPNCGNNEYAFWLKRQYVVGTESGGGADTTPPTVASVVPAAGATGVGVSTAVSATFSEAIAPSSVTTGNFVLRDGNGTAVAASVSASGSTATLQPSASLSPSTTYTATLVGGGVTDLAGNALAADYSWSFTTGAPDTTPPTVASVVPAAGATGVGVSTAVSATFSEAIAPSSVTTGNFVLRDGNGTAVAASVSASGSTATLQPSASLSPSTTYTATLVGGGVTDLAGNALAADYSWSFTTAAGPSCPCSLWGSGAVPQTAAFADGSAVELGVRFRSDVAGYVTGIRFYKGAGNTGTHVGHLWSESGAQLATATFSGESATGWQQVSFSSPVAISANTTYVASYYAPAGHYALDRPYFTVAYDNPPLHGLADGNGGGNGVYSLGTGFPTRSYQSSNYWVDVVFTTDLTDNSPPASTITFPAVSGSYSVATWNAGCASAGFCGTASDSLSGVKRVELSLRQVSSGAYWNGSSFAGTSEQFLGATGTSSWSFPLAASAFPADGQYAVRVRAVDNANNVESASSRTFTIDTALPTVAASFPVESGAYSAAGWAAGCSPAGFCGSASDGGAGLQKVEWSLKRVSTARWWNGTSFGSTTEAWRAASGTGTWSSSFAGTSFPAQGQYTLRVRATDLAGNVTTTSGATFVYDATVPTATLSFPVASGAYTTASWTAGCGSPGMCGTAGDAGAGVQKVELSIRRGTGNYWNGSSFGSTSEVYFAATGTTAWSFAFPAANFPANSEYRVRVRATDNVGNVNAPAQTRFTFTP